MMAALATAMTAQAADVDTLKSVELQELQVVSTRATRNTPVAFTDMNKEQLQRVNHGQDVPYLLSLTPSVTMTSDAGNGIGYTSLRIRGTAPERINITANGIPMNDAESAQLYWVNMGDFASSVQTMQIQRGVGTSTNGAGAFGATVNMQTENIGMKPFVGIDLSGGSYYSHKETVRFGTGLLDGHWGLQGRLSNIGSKGYIDRASAKLNSYFLQAGWFGDNTVVKLITFNGIEETYHAWDYSSKYEQAIYGRTFNPCGATTWDNDKFYDNQTDNYHQQNYQLLLTQRLGRFMNLNAGLHYTRGEGYYEQYKIEAKWADYGLWTAADGDTETDGTLTYKPIVKGDLVRQKVMANDFYGAVASVNFDNKDGLEATVGGGWNKYDGDHYGKVIWQSMNPYKYYYNKDNDAKWKNAAGEKYFYGFADGVTSEKDFEYYRDNAKKTDFNIYGKVNYTFMPGLNAFADLQYRHINYKMQAPFDWWDPTATAEYVINDKYNFFNPKVGLNYDISPNHRVYASYAIAHKEPTRNDYQSNYGLTLKAERLNDLEAGYKYLTETFSASANFYWMNYKDQFVLTGALNEIGEAVAMNVPKSYRMGIELEAAWKPADWLRWDANATFSKNRVKDALVTLETYNSAKNGFDAVGTELIGDQPLSFSPDVIFNNIITATYSGLRASLTCQYIGKQFLTNSGFETMKCWDENGNETQESIVLDDHLTANLDLSYDFALAKFGVKSGTIGITLYNLFSTKYDTNGWAAPKYMKDGNGKVIAYNGSCMTDWAVRDQWGVGFAPSAPFNVMAHLSLNF
jgi:iron complex outermembrane receptor protein